MKKCSLILAFLLILLIPVAACAEREPVPILYTYYRQMGWGDRVEIGYVDSNGDCWMLSGADSELEWPFHSEDQLRYLSEHIFEKIDTMKFDDRFALESLIGSVKVSDEKSHPVADDAGTERTYAVRYRKDEAPELILLGMSGDDMFENTDPNAQGLYLAARNLFPGVTAYGDGMGPAGFIPVNIAEFCGLSDLTGASVKAVFNDCEAGPHNIDMSRPEQDEILSLISGGVVTGKVSAISTTGGYRTYYFYRGSEHLGSVDICDGLLYRNDGMYSIEAK